MNSFTLLEELEILNREIDYGRATDAEKSRRLELIALANSAPELGNERDKLRRVLLAFVAEHSVSSPDRSGRGICHCNLCEVARVALGESKENL